MTSDLGVVGLGKFFFFGGRLSVLTWERGASLRSLQGELFDVFPADCDCFLNIPASDILDAFARMVDVPPSEIRHIMWGAPETRTRGVAAQQLWCELADACSRAGRSNLCTDELGQVVLEFGLGLLALDFEKDELKAFLEDVCAQVQRDELSVVKAGLDRDIRQSHLEALSWAGPFSSEARCTFAH